MTPKSINTLLGISQLITAELRPEHQVFIVEFGEYNPQDIANLTAFLKPDYGVFTPIGRQHLARFGTVEKIAQTFEPFVTFFEKNPQKLLTAENNVQFFPALEHSYGQRDQATYQVTEHQTTRRGTEFSIKVAGLNRSLFSPLFGAHQAVNILPSIWLSEQLGMNRAQVLQRIATLPAIPRRHEPFFGENEVLVLDNSYNTNPDSVQASLQLLDELPADRKLLLTLGFTELGKDSAAIHTKFGRRLAKTVDYLGLIESPWTKAIIDGFKAGGGKTDQVVTGRDFDQTFAALQPHIIPKSVVLFEGGYREVYV